MRARPIIVAAALLAVLPIVPQPAAAQLPPDCQFQPSGKSVRRALAADPLEERQWALSTMHFQQALPKGDGGGVSVVVMDTGVDGTHPDLVGKVLPGYNAVTRTPIPAGANSDSEGHGTAIASLIAANRNDDIGMTGLAPSTRIVPIVAGDAGGVETTALIRGIDWAIANAPRPLILNMSFGSCGASVDERAAINRAIAAGAIVIAASGNEADQGNPIEYPAAYPGVTAVGATTRDDRRAFYSSFGSFVDLTAPGGSGAGGAEENIIVAAPAAVIPGCPNPCYIVEAGTSFSAPYVAALDALVWSTNPSLSAADVQGIVAGTSIDLGPPGQDNEFGQGRIDANGALARARGSRQAGRVAGADRYGTAAAFSARTYPEGAPVAFVARGDVFSPDALAGGPAAIVRGAPILLTPRCEPLPGPTEQELRRLGATSVIVLGGDAAVCDAVVSQLSSIVPSVRRVTGADRYGTAAAIAIDAFPSAPTAFLARADTFSPDSLVGGPAAGRLNAPILLSRQCSLPAETIAALDTIRASNVVVLGGDAAICDAIVSQLTASGRSVSRLAGPDRYNTAVVVGRSGLTPPLGAAVVARGDVFSPDALTAGPFAAKIGAPLLLTGQCHAPPATAIELNRVDVGNVVLSGGAAAICDQQIVRLL